MVSKDDHPVQITSSQRRRFVCAAVIIVAVGVALGACSRPGGESARENGAVTKAREAVMTVTAAPALQAQLKRTISLNGSVFAWQDVIIASEVGGYRVAEVLVDVGDRVTRGQRLVALSTALLEAEVATKRAMLAQRRAELTNAAAALERGKSLSNMNVLSQADLDRLTADQLAKRAALESARADLDTSELRLKFTNVTAPDDGVITSRTVTVGQIAQAGGEMLRLLRSGRIEWRGEVPETRLGELRAGQPVTIVTADGTPFTGTIRVVSPVIASGNRTGLIYVDLPADERLRPGMFARGEIEIGTGPGVTLPLESLVSADGYSYVFVVRADRTVERRRIETGGVLGASIEVMNGLEPTDLVVNKGAGFLKDGDLVNVGTESGS
jgi:HlyD family secretion protein